MRHENGEQALRARDPKFFEAWMRLKNAAEGTGLLEPRLRELVGLAVNGAVTHLHEPAMRAHIRAALEAGATTEQIMEVLQLISVLGIHACSLGISSLQDEMNKADIALPAALQAALTPRQERIKEDFTRDRGYWSERWETLLRLDAEFFEGYCGYSSHPWKTGSLAPKERELMYIAIDASTTHLYDPGLRVHYRNALRYGATMEEILEVLKLTSLIGIQSCTVGAAILEEELARR
jgi:alkylhydroperoxidase/carboxymuconolactone decarboxylase family protein YurZ